MPLFLIEAQQTPASWARLMAHPENRAKASQDGAHIHEGRSVGYWYAIDPGRIFSIIEATNELAAAGLLSAMFGSGAFERIRTTVLLTPQQMLAANETAVGMPYAPPGGTPPSLSADLLDAGSVPRNPGNHHGG
jgi:hypothetical protein